MDGDGDMDIVSASSYDDTIAWYENNGASDPSWTAADIATSAELATSVYVADIDGDGDMDIISSSQSDNTIAWYENNGASDPSFTAADIATDKDGAMSVFAADMDGDGDMDIVSASANDDTIAWYENTGFSYSYSWDVDSGGAPSDGTYAVTVAGADKAGNAYSGTDSITFTLDTSAPTVTLTDTDSDNLVSTSEVVTITAGFSKTMTPTPTISITGIVTNVIMELVDYTVTDPVVFNVTVANSGGNKYFIDGQSQLSLNLVPGQTYRFDQSDSSNSGHPIRFSTTSDGTHNSGSAYTTNVSSVGTPGQSGAYTLITIPSNGPSNLYYYCANHPSMGGDITKGIGYYYRWDTSSGTLTTGNYAATVSGTDSIGNAYAAGTQSITFTVDTTSPTLTITTPSGPKVSNSSIVVTLTYNEAVTGLTTDTSQFSAATNVASLELLSASSDGKTYTLRINPTGEGLVKLTHAPGSPPVKDLAGNSIASTVSCSFTYDTSGPTVTFSDTDDDNLLAASDTVTITASFNEGMTATPTISISGTSISGQRMTKISGGASGTGSATQIGGDIDGEAAGDASGDSVSFSSDGSRVAIGAILNDGGGNNTGHVRIYQYNNNSWSQLGADINGEAANDTSGYSVSLSSDGSRVAIGAYNNDAGGSNSGHVRIYDYNGSAWVQVGADINGEAANDRSGRSVSLSSDGSRVAIGAEGNNGGGTDSGHVRIYDYNGSAWEQVGADINGEATDDRSGYSVSLSSDGSIVAVGAYNNDGAGSNSGHVRIYQYNNNSWSQLGSDIDGEAANDYSGYSVSLSSDGSRVAIGALSNDGGGNNSGHVRIYQYNNNSWSQLGADIDGEAAGDSSHIVSLSSDGSRVAIGAEGNNGGGTDSGHVRIYDYNGSAWVQVVVDIDGEAADDRSGLVSLSSDGSRVAIGAPFNDGNGTSSGHVRIYSLPRGESYQYAWDVDSGGAPSDGTYRATVAGSDLAGNAYSGTDSITFALDTSAPTVTLTDTDSDNVVSASEVVTITAGFSEAMTATPTISITGIVTSVIMTPVSGTNSYTFAWDTSSGTLSDGTYTATVSGTDLIGNAYVAGTQSITFTIDSSTPTVTITTNDPDNTIKPGDPITITATFSEPMASGPSITIGSAVSNAALTATSSTTFTYSWSTSGVSAGSYTVTVTGTDLAENTYAGSDSIEITLDATAPTVTLSDTDDDNFLAASDTVTITAAFSEVMTSTPTISISGTSISNEVMTKIIGGVGSPTAALIGDDIDGEAADDQSGYSVSLSSDGLRVAIGARGNDGNGSNSGHVRIYELQSDNSWSKLGDDIDGEAASDQSGYSVSLSSDGSRVAIGAIYNDGGGTNSGHVRIYELQSDNSWSKLGDDIDGEAAYDQSGWSVSLSSDGSSVAIGAIANDGGGTNSGHVRIYELQSDNSWSKLGDDIDGEAASDQSGYSVSLSSDGSRVAIGAIRNAGGETNSGHVRIYELQSDNSWSKLGDDIDGEAADDQSGYSVSLSSDGLRVAIGARLNDGNGSNSGHVRIYEYNSSSNSWSKLGDDIDGEAADDQSGWSVSLSSDGSSVAIGAIANDGGGTNSGHVRIYEYNSSSNSWYQFFQDIDGEIAADFSGNSVSLSSDGSRVAIGAYFNNENGNNSGHVRLLSVAKLDSYQYTWNISSTLYDGDYQATVAGADLAGNAYSGTDSITFTLDTSAPTVTLTDTDSDNVVSASEVVTITAGFSEAMTATPTISITGIVTSVIMIPVSGTNSYTYTWDTSLALTDGTYAATVSGTDLIGNAYVAGTQSITFTVDSSTPTVTITTNDPDNTIKPGDNITVTVTFNEPMASGPRITIGSAVSNVALTATNSTTFTYTWSTGSVSAGSYTVTVTGTDLAGNTYTGNDSINIKVDATAPTVTLTDTDDDNFLAASDTVTITAAFSEAMTSTPTISISGTSISNEVMTKIAAASGTGSFTQLGVDIDGEWANDNSGSSVSLSSDGRTIAIGSPGNRGPRNAQGDACSSCDGIGHVRIFNYVGTNWIQVGNDIDGNFGQNHSRQEQTGTSVSLSADGKRVAIGSPGSSLGANKNGRVRIYDYNGSAWMQVGSDIDGGAAGDEFGWAVSLSSDGSKLAIGATHAERVGDKYGHVQIYEYTPSGVTSWTQLGADIDGEVADDKFGVDVSLSSDGSRVAIRGVYDVHIYDYTPSGVTSWTQVAKLFNDQNEYASSVSLSSDGSRVAIGAQLNNGANGTYSGQVRIYEYTPSGVTSWTQLGADIDGEAANDYSGGSVSLSSDGSIVAIGARQNVGVNGNSQGHVRIYEYTPTGLNSWTLVVPDIEGEAAQDNSSGDKDQHALSLSSDGSIVAIGAPQNDGYTLNAGHVRVFSISPGESYQYAWDVDSGGAPSDGTYRATVAGADLAGNAYSGTDSITFTLDTSAPTVTLTDTDSDNLVSTSEVVTITAGFSEVMTATPTISITGIVTNVIMTPVSGTNSYTYTWDTSLALSEGTYAATVSGTDLIGNAYVAGTQSITFRVDTSTPTVSITTNDPDNTIKPGDNITVTVTFNEAMASGPRITIGSAVSNVALTATNSTTFTYSWSTSGVSAGSYTVTVTGTDLAGNTYAGSDSIKITLDSTAPTVTLTDTDDDNFLAASDTVTITAAFSEAMTSTPTISIANTSISNQLMTKIIGGSGSGSHTLLGADIDGEAAGDFSGHSVSLSSDGSRVAIGAWQNDGNGTSSGHVRIYDYNGSAWAQVGQDIDGEAGGDQSGWAVSLSSDGSRVAIGAIENNGNGSDSGHVRIYDYNGSAWVQVGADIDGEAADDKSGISVALSSDGSRVAIGSEKNQENGSDSGHVRIYDYTPSGTSSWTQVGGDIDSETPGDNSGHIALSSDGSRVAIGGPYNDGGGNNSGHVRIYQYNNNSWSQLGADINGEAGGSRIGDLSGFSVSLSSDGSRVAIGAHLNDGTSGNENDQRGHVRIYQYNNNSWSQLGADIDGEAAGDASGYSVSLSSDGSRVAIGAYGNDGNGSNSGHVRIYDYNGSAWVQVGADIDGENQTVSGSANDNSGYSVSLSSDGSRVAIGAPYNDGNGSDSGHVRIYTLSPGESYQYAWDVDSGGAPSDGTYRATIAGADLAGNAYSGTDSITFTVDSTAPTVTLTDTDSDNLVSVSEVVTITAGFSEAMTATPTISITGIVTNVIMIPVSGTNSYTYTWDTSLALSDGTYAATVSGTDLIGNAYVAGTQSITFTVDTSTPTVSITTNDPDNTIKPGDNITVTVTFNEPMASGPRITIGSAVSNVALTATNSTTFTYTWSTGSVSAGSYTVTVTGTDLAGNTYTGNDSINIKVDATAPTVTLTDTDDDNFLAASDTVTITAAFSEAMTSTPTISIANTSISNQLMTKIIGGSGSGSHTLLGDDIDGEAAGDYTGTQVSLSSDGTRVAISATLKDSNGTDSGQVRIFELQSNNSWSQLGQNIDGDPGDNSGSSVSLSSDGSIVAIGAFSADGGGGSSGSVRIYELQSNNSWSQLGSDINGERVDDRSGTSVSLSSDGSRVAIGARYNDDYGNNSGHVRIYEFQSNNSWSQLGSDINGETANDESGFSVSLSSDGSRVAIGAPYNDANGSNSGHVRVYEYSGGSWRKLGSDIDGDAAGDASGWSVSLSSDGSRVAIGAPYGDNSNFGYVRIYEFQSNNSWSQLGQDIDGEAGNDTSGYSVSLSSDGSIVAISAPENDGNGNRSGHVRIYEFQSNNSWSQLGPDIDGEAADDVSGRSVSLSSDGSRVAISAVGNDGNGTNSGHVRVYSLKGETYQYAWDVDSGGGAPSDGTYYATVAGADLAGNAYSGTDSITFTIDASAPTVTLTDTDADNIISTTLSPTNTVTITASFSKPMTATPTIFITGVVTNVAMTRISGTNSYTYNWNTSTPTLAAGAYSVTVSGTDTIGNAYAGTDSITFTISPTFYLDANGVTVKCRGCNARRPGGS